MWAEQPKQQQKHCPETFSAALTNTVLVDVLGKELHWLFSLSSAGRTRTTIKRKGNKTESTQQFNFLVVSSDTEIMDEVL